MSEMQVLVKKRIRGYILVCLSLYSQESVNSEVIADFVRTCGLGASNADVEEQIAYLKDKGYLKVVEKGDLQISTKKTVIAEITAKGVDLKEGTMEKDAGIMFPVG